MTVVTRLSTSSIRSPRRPVYRSSRSLSGAGSLVASSTTGASGTGRLNEHNGLVPRDHWIEDWERQRVIDYFDCHPLDGYRRLTFMMLDEDVVALSPSTTYRVLSKAGRLDRWNGKPSKKGTGFVQPLRPHQHWHTDISYLNLGGTFYYLCSFLDGASRAVVHWEIRESMTEADVECILERAKELYPDARPRIISDKPAWKHAKGFLIDECQILPERHEDAVDVYMTERERNFEKIFGVSAEHEIAQHARSGLIRVVA